MGLFSMLAGLFSGSSAHTVCVVDGDRMAGGERVGPGERFQALNRLSRFASREELEVKVVFSGRPLREAADGESYNGVQVFYAENTEEVTSRIRKLLSSAGRKGVLMTSDRVIEDEMKDRGYATMRLWTLRKAMEAASGENGGGRREYGGDRFGGRDRGDREGGRRHRHRGRGPRRDQPQGEGRPATPAGQPGSESTGAPRPAESAPSQPAQHNSPAADSSVKNLIDLVE